MPVAPKPGAEAPEELLIRGLLFGTAEAVPSQAGQLELEFYDEAHLYGIYDRLMKA